MLYLLIVNHNLLFFPFILLAFSFCTDLYKDVAWIIFRWSQWCWAAQIGRI